MTNIRLDNLMIIIQQKESEKGHFIDESASRTLPGPIGAGARWGKVANALAANALVISSGDSKQVGVGGVTSIPTSHF